MSASKMMLVQIVPAPRPPSSGSWRTDDPRGAFTPARMAKNKNIPISTISVGTTSGTVEIPHTSGDSVDQGAGAG
ncbi:hypothetical protein OG563_40975 [Nocardia vinacea]|uniref:Uncharacterized protein n=1 Tax=Nocardia vinacea TaxID=96468 RepID=A0ABZ1YQ73_9NOCA|nr:hypothetical protein [Nocardia vinacea]